MAIITISRDYSCGGTQIARHVAERLGHHFVDKATMEEILKGYGLIDFEKVYEAAPGPLSRFDDRRKEIMKMLDAAILAVARHGDAVLLGRGSFAVLRDVADVLHVRLRAGLEARTRTVIERHGFTDRAAAEAFLAERDRARASFVEASYGVSWDSVRGFDLVIATDRFAPALAVEWIVEAVNATADGSGGAQQGLRSSRDIEVDSLLAQSISEALRCTATHVQVESR